VKNKHNKTGRKEVSGSTNSEPGKTDDTAKGNLRDNNSLSRRDTTDRELDNLFKSVTETPQHEPKQIGKYILRREIGHGGFGIVHLADDTELHRKVAIKINRYNPSVEDKNSLQREARVGAALTKHPNIAAVYDFVIDGDFCGIVSEFIPGNDLGKWVLANHPSHDSIVRLLIKITDAISFAHGEGVIHRDIKPSNILMDESDNPQIVDFGLARITTPDATVPMDDKPSGTSHYIAPERIDGDSKGDERSDIYSLGATMYELFTGRHLHEGSDAKVMYAAIHKNPKRFPKTQNIDPKIESVCFRCLAKKPKKRYQSMACLRNDLENCLSSVDSTSVVFDGLLRRIAGWCSQTNTQAKIAIGAITLFVITTILVSLWLSDIPPTLGTINLQHDEERYNQIIHKIGLDISDEDVAKQCETYLTASSSPMMRASVTALLENIRSLYDESILLKISWGNDYHGWIGGGDQHTLTVLVDGRKVKEFKSIKSVDKGHTRLDIKVTGKLGQRSLKLDLIEEDTFGNDILGSDKISYALNDGKNNTGVLENFLHKITIHYEIKKEKHKRIRLSLPPWKAGL
jgi:serine/threonine protein kinase